MNEDEMKQEDEACLAEEGRDEEEYPPDNQTDQED